MSELRIGASSRFYTDYPGGRFSPTEMVEYFHRVGFGGIDFDLETVPAMGEDWKRIMSDIAGLAAKYDICMDYGHLPFHKVTVNGVASDEAFRKNMLRSIEAAGFAGVRHAVIHPWGTEVPIAEFDFDGDLKKNIEIMTEYAEFAAKCGVSLAFENMRNPKAADGFCKFSALPEGIAAVADHFGMENCWDFGHANTSHIPQGDSIRLLGKRLTVLHVNDNHAKEDLHLLPYFGTINWDDAMAGLHDIGYNHVFNFECRTRGIPPVGREELGAYALELGRSLAAKI